MVQRRSYLSLESNILDPINLTRYTTLKAPIKVLGFILSHIKIYTDAPYFCWQEMQNQKRGFFNLIILFQAAKYPLKDVNEFSIYVV